MPAFAPDAIEPDDDLYRAANAAVVALRRELLRRAAETGDYSAVRRFGQHAMRLGANTIRSAAGDVTAAEDAYRLADDLVSASNEGWQP